MSDEATSEGAEIPSSGPEVKETEALFAKHDQLTSEVEHQSLTLVEYRGISEEFKHHRVLVE